MKELKDELRRQAAEPVRQIVWNPVKELKEDGVRARPASAPDDVESGEGIESQ